MCSPQPFSSGRIQFFPHLFYAEMLHGYVRFPCQLELNTFEDQGRRDRRHIRYRVPFHALTRGDHHRCEERQPTTRPHFNRDLQARMAHILVRTVFSAATIFQSFQSPCCPTAGMRRHDRGRREAIVHVQPRPTARRPLRGSGCSPTRLDKDAQCHSRWRHPEWTHGDETAMAWQPIVKSSAHMLTCSW